MEPKIIKVLLIEDDLGDVFLIKEILSIVKGIFIELVHAERLSDGLAYLDRQDIDAVLLDLGLPDSQGMDTVLKVCGHAPKIPVIAMTIIGDEDVAVRAVQEGAQDYLVKGTVNEDMLVRSIRYAIERKRIENEKEKLILKLKEALDKVKVLSGLLPTCASCKKIRNDKGDWEQIESYISKHSEAKFSHGVCPECTKKLYPEYFKELYPEYLDDKEE